MTRLILRHLFLCLAIIAGACFGTWQMLGLQRGDDSIGEFVYQLWYC